MARCKHYDYGQTRLVAINYAKQILLGTFENEVSVQAYVRHAHVKRRGRSSFADNQLIDDRVDYCVFAARYQNDKKGAPAYDAALLVKGILYGYSKGTTSSRGIKSLCRENTRSLLG